MRALLIQHDHVARPGPVGERLAARGYDITELPVVPAARRSSPDVRCAFPDPLGWDLIVPMGGPWSVDDPRVASWLVPELDLLATAHAAGVPVLGICFGGQALATALGGGVERAPRTEAGWVAVETDDPSLVAPGPWFQLHRDRWRPPPGAAEIARTSVGPQAFVAGRSMGLQFHPEITAAGFALWLADGAGALMRAAGADPGAVMAEVVRAEPDAARRTRSLVDAFLDRAARVEPHDGDRHPNGL
ncbi:type 1 glutamine amidotransferase [Actinomadura sp. NAK00032]|uniref:type 1 glutamine amidotransferase n=1 Tax=Actinomadura sp. NAK00032 TaxID=2742128 RepID=UPI00159295F9|nr:type 1 glutamine amidotransferase [Actinomadura sp. NAK00032]QKW38107.1 type 1 glutamine amidotransferase [Actinomadura sp. NAK00032]